MKGAQAIKRNIKITTDNTERLYKNTLQQAHENWGETPKTAQRKIELLAHLDIVNIEHKDIVRAIDIHRLHRFSFWDLLIIRMAQIR